METTQNETSSKVNTLEIQLNSLKLQINDILHTNGDYENSNQANDNTSSDQTFITGSLKESVKNLTSQVRSISEKLEKVKLKQENMNEEILGRVRKDLQHESARILEDFKHDLKTSINKIEDQLREKVDRFNLDEFGRRIDNKFNFEINKKLDRNDLKKNNNFINRKIDTLENKISKTLVDTLIDLQMEEAPLITKKTQVGEKCASCNQLVPHHHDFDHKYKTGGKFHGNHGNMKDKMGAINELSIQDEATLAQGSGVVNSQGNNHGGTVSAGKESNNSKKLHLPDINPSKSSDLNTNMKKSSRASGNNYSSGQNFSSNIINDDLDKKYLGPNDLIKTINKAYEGKIK